MLLTQHPVISDKGYREGRARPIRGDQQQTNPMSALRFASGSWAAGRRPEAARPVGVEVGRQELRDECPSTGSSCGCPVGGGHLPGHACQCWQGWLVKLSALWWRHKRGYLVLKRNAGAGFVARFPPWIYYQGTEYLRYGVLGRERARAHCDSVPPGLPKKEQSGGKERLAWQLEAEQAARGGDAGPGTTISFVTIELEAKDQEALFFSPLD